MVAMTGGWDRGWSRSESDAVRLDDWDGQSAIHPEPKPRSEKPADAPSIACSIATQRIFGKGVHVIFFQDPAPTGVDVPVGLY